MKGPLPPKVRWDVFRHFGALRDRAWRLHDEGRHDEARSVDDEEVRLRTECGAAEWVSEDDYDDEADGPGQTAGPVSTGDAPVSNPAEADPEVREEMRRRIHQMEYEAEQFMKAGRKDEAWAIWDHVGRMRIESGMVERGYDEDRVAAIAPPRTPEPAPPR
jgi:hypothetical protein